MKSNKVNPDLLTAGVTAAVIGAITIWLKEKCARCNSKWRLVKTCAFCNEKVCSEHGTAVEPVTYKDWIISEETRCCNIHLESFQNYVSDLKQSIDRSEKVIVYSNNYKGHIPLPKLGRTISTKYYRQKATAEYELRILAAQNDCDIVQDVEFNKSENQNGNYIYSVWSASGTI